MTAPQPGVTFQPPVPLDPWTLIHSVRDTLNQAAHPTPVSRETFQRDVSTAHYAVFHAPAQNNAVLMLSANTLSPGVRDAGQFVKSWTSSKCIRSVRALRVFDLQTKTVGTSPV